VTCLSCNNVSTAFDPFVIIPLPIPNKDSVNKVNFFKTTVVPFNLFYEVEKMEQETNGDSLDESENVIFS
jgi:ubiquitin C-terminal hydrolase